MTRRTLILACSATKIRSIAVPIPAWQRYDGPAWRTFRANISSAPAPEIDALALSAEFGLISAYRPIPDYDRRMTVTRQLELAELVQHQVAEHELAGEILLCGGVLYRELFAAVAAKAGIRDHRISYTRGGIGEQLGQLKAWLRRDGQ